MKPVVDGLEKVYEGKVEFRRVNVGAGEGLELAQELGVQYVPTFAYVNSDGVIAKQTVGAQTEKQMREILDTLK